MVLLTPEPKNVTVFEGRVFDRCFMKINKVIRICHSTIQLSHLQTEKLET